MRPINFACLTFGLAAVIGCGLDRSALDPNGSDGGVDAAGAPGRGGAGGSATGGSAAGTGGAGVAGMSGTCPAYKCAAPMCANGVKTDANGCPTCSCNPILCPAIGCATKCAYGEKTDANGCTTCVCNPPPVCGPVCDIYCAYGNVRDAKGCPTCQCNPAPSGACSATECGPSPDLPSKICPDGKTVAGPVCLRDAAGLCGWHVTDCPPPASDTCRCPSGQLCINQIGGPATAGASQAPVPLPAPVCALPSTGCDALDECACLSGLNGRCKSAGTPRTCSCDNGVR
jgi:hypothetical protein